MHLPTRIDCHLHYYASAFANQLLGQVRGTVGSNVPIRAVSSARAGWRDLADLRRVLDLTDVQPGVILRIALNGTFDRFPDVRFMFCQLGGFAPACCARWDFHCRQRRLISAATGEPMPAWASHTLTEYLARVWLDTHSQDRHLLRLVLDLVGDQGIVLGGDYPLTVPEDGVLHVMGEVSALGLAPESVQRIERDNARRLLGMRHGSRYSPSQ